MEETDVEANGEREKRGFLQRQREMRYLWRFKKNPVIAKPVMGHPDSENAVTEQTVFENTV